MPGSPGRAGGRGSSARSSTAATAGTPASRTRRSSNATSIPTQPTGPGLITHAPELLQPEAGTGPRRCAEPAHVTARPLRGRHGPACGRLSFRRLPPGLCGAAPPRARAPKIRPRALRRKLLGLVPWPGEPLRPHPHPVFGTGQGGSDEHHQNHRQHSQHHRRAGQARRAARADQLMALI